MSLAERIALVKKKIAGKQISIAVVIKMILLCMR